MTHYLLQLAYTPEAWAAQLKEPKNRIEIVQPVLAKLGGRFETAFYSFGEYDMICIVEFPDAVSAAAMAEVIAASGAMKAFKTTPLLTIEEGISALRKAGTVASLYKAPK